MTLRQNKDNNNCRNFMMPKCLNLNDFCISSRNDSRNAVAKNLLTASFSAVRRFALLVSPGFEPRQRESKSLVLPLHHETTQCECSHRGLRAHFYHMAWHLASIKYVLRSVSGLVEPRNVPEQSSGISCRSDATAFHPGACRDFIHAQRGFH